MRLVWLPILAGAALALAGCSIAPQGAGPNAFASSATDSSANRAIVGGLIDNDIGRQLDDADRRMAASAEYRALEYGRAGSPVAWRGRSGAYGEVVPGASYQVNAYDCREYTHTVYIDDEPQVARGTACRQTDGSWQTVT